MPYARISQLRGSGSEHTGSQGALRETGRDGLMGGYAVTPEERARIGELLRQQNRATYRAIAQTVGRSVQSVFQIASMLVVAGEIPPARIGRPRRGDD
jgi:hypothetical protein